MIRLKTKQDIEMIAASGRILANILKRLSQEVSVGLPLEFLDNLARRLIKEAGAQPAFLGYQPESGYEPFPAAVCLSLNEQVVHGLPSPYKLQSGDLLKIDLGVDYRGYFSDAGITLGIGEIPAAAKNLMEATRKALEAAISEIQPAKHLGDLGFIIATTIQKAGFTVIRGLTGHGVGFEVHEEPTVLNYGQRGEGLELKPGMVLAIEPMACLGKGKIVQRSDDSFATADASLSAHFEHTVAVTKNGPRILTL